MSPTPDLIYELEGRVSHKLLIHIVQDVVRSRKHYTLHTSSLETRTGNSFHGYEVMDTKMYSDEVDEFKVGMNSMRKHL